MLTLDLPPDIEMRLEALAERIGRSKASVIEEAILEHLDDRDDLAIAEERLRALHRGASTTASLADVMARHGLAD